MLQSLRARERAGTDAKAPRPLPGAVDDAYWRAANRLGAMVLAPVAAALQGRKVYVVADGALQTVPFAALPIARPGQPSSLGRPLIVSNEVVSLPSLSVLTLLKEQQRPPRTDSIAVIADPVYDADDSRIAAAKPAKPPAAIASTTRELDLSIRRVRGAGRAFQRLYAAGDESAAIARLASTRRVSRFEGLAATRAATLGSELASFDVVHFATHGLLNDQRPELSGLVLSLYDESGESVDGFLRLIDVYGMTLSANLVVLSACESGRGKDVSGEGLIGLTRGFLLAGASRVVSSLWSVNDVATTELMSVFYEAMLRDGRPPAAALRQAQIHMWQSGRWRSPYFWAAFSIYGD